MNDEFETYLNKLNMTKTLKRRVNEISQFYEELLNEKIIDIFVNEYLDDSGTRQYENMFFFTSHLMMEAHEFVTQDNLDILPYHNNVTYFAIRKQHYDFKQSNADSRLNIEVYVTTSSSEMTANFKASRQNCDYLRDVLKNRIIPNIQYKRD